MPPEESPAVRSDETCLSPQRTVGIQMKFHTDELFKELFNIRTLETVFVHAFPVFGIGEQDNVLLPTTVDFEEFNNSFLERFDTISSLPASRWTLLFFWVDHYPRSPNKGNLRGKFNLFSRFFLETYASVCGFTS